MVQKLKDIFLWIIKIAGFCIIFFVVKQGLQTINCEYCINYQAIEEVIQDLDYEI